MLARGQGERDRQHSPQDGQGRAQPRSAARLRSIIARPAITSTYGRAISRNRQAIRPKATLAPQPRQKDGVDRQQASERAMNTAAQFSCR